jgi:hypothetical protein
MSGRAKGKQVKKQGKALDALQREIAAMKDGA